MTTTNETRPVYAITNDFDMLDIGMKESILVETMKKFIGDKRKIPTRLLEDLKKVRNQNKKRAGYTLHMDCKNTRKGLKVYYKQYKHLDKYYPKDLDSITQVGSLQRGVRAVDIEKKYERLIRTKCDSHIWTYYDKEDRLCWIKADLFRRVRDGYSESEKQHIEKIDFKIFNYGISALANEMIWGFTAVFDNVKSRDDYYDWTMK